MLELRRLPVSSQGMFALGVSFRKPTLVEGLAVAGGVTAAYAGFRLGVRAYQKSLQVCDRVRSWWNGPLRLLPAPREKSIGASGVKPESPVAGSEEFSMTTPKCQALVGYQKGGNFMVAGNCIRIDDWLLIPDHVLSAVNGAPIEIRSFDQKRVVKLTSDELSELQILDTDMLFVRLSGSRFADMGLSQARVATNLPERVGAHCSVVGCYGEGTLGTVTHSVLFGKVNYSGSTFKGYSGAAYMQGAQLVGIHLHGGTYNTGYSASYLLSVLKYLAKIVPEDTAEFLETMRDAGAIVVEDPTWRDIDDTRVRINGRYHIVGRAEYRRVYGERKNKFVGYVDNEAALISEPSGEEKENLCGASSSLINFKDCPELDSRPFTNAELTKCIRMLMRSNSKERKQLASQQPSQQ